PPAANPPGIVSCAPFAAGLGPLGYAITLAQGQTDTGNDFGNHFNTKQCPEDPTAKVTLFVDGVQFTTVQAAYNAATNGDVIGIFIKTVETVVLGDDKTLTITQCANAKITAADPTKPVWTISSTGALTIIGPDAAGGTIGWLVQSGSNDLRGVRALGRPQFGIKIEGSDNHVSFNSVSGSPVGVHIDGNDNDVRGGTVSGNSGNGVEIAAGASLNSFRTANVQKNAGNGIQVD